MINSEWQKNTKESALTRFGFLQIPVRYQTDIHMSMTAACRRERMSELEHTLRASVLSPISTAWIVIQQESEAVSGKSNARWNVHCSIFTVAINICLSLSLSLFPDHPSARIFVSLFSAGFFFFLVPNDVIASLFNGPPKSWKSNAIIELFARFAMDMSNIELFRLSLLQHHRWIEWVCERERKRSGICTQNCAHIQMNELWTKKHLLIIMLRMITKFAYF